MCLKAVSLITFPIILIASMQGAAELMDLEVGHAEDHESAQLLDENSIEESSNIEAARDSRGFQASERHVPQRCAYCDFKIPFRFALDPTASIAPWHEQLSCLTNPHAACICLWCCWTVSLVRYGDSLNSNGRDMSVHDATGTGRGGRARAPAAGANSAAPGRRALFSL